MSRIIEAIDDLVAGVPVLNKAWNVVKDVVDTLWQEIATPVLEFVFSLLGITDEDVLNSYVHTQRIIADDVNDKAHIEDVLAMVQKDVPILTSIAMRNAATVGRYRSYDGKAATYIDGRPDGNITMDVVSASAIKTVLDSINGQNNTVLTAILESMNKYVWCKYILQGTHAYRPQYNTLTYNGNSSYTLKDVLYDYVNNRYNCTIELEDTVTTEKGTLVVTEVVNKDATTDTVTVTTYDIVSVDRVYGDDSYTDTVSSVDMYDVAIGTVEESNDYTVDSTVVTTEIYDTTVLYVATYALNRYYIVTYKYNEIDTWYWVLDSTSTTYPSITDGGASITNLELLPIVSIRTDKVNANADKNSERYKSTKAILDVIGLDVDTMCESYHGNETNVKDAFVMFAMSPSDNDPVISKCLYAMADVIYEDGTLQSTVEGDTVYAFSMTEGTYNQVCKWDTQGRTVKTGSIGPVGTHNHSIVNGTDLYMRKQETENQYIEYYFTKVTSMTGITYGGEYNVSTADLSNPLFRVPLSMEFVRRLTAGEQAKLYVKTLVISTYHAEIVHLEWYKTSVFGQLLQVVAIAILIISLGSGAGISAILYGMAAAYALKKVMGSNAPDWLKAVAAVAYVAVSVTYGSGPDQSMLMTGVQAVSLTASAVTMYTQAEMEKLEDKRKDFNVLADKKFEELEKKQKELDSRNKGASTDFIASMTRYAQVPAYKDYFDISLGGPGYNYNMLYKLDTMYNYDKLYKVGQLS